MKNLLDLLNFEYGLQGQIKWFLRPYTAMDQMLSTRGLCQLMIASN